jgi:hypothetical protein
VICSGENTEPGTLRTAQMSRTFAICSTVTRRRSKKPIREVRACTTHALSAARNLFSRVRDEQNGLAFYDRKLARAQRSREVRDRQCACDRGDVALWPRRSFAATRRSVA